MFLSRMRQRSHALFTSWKQSTFSRSPDSNIKGIIDQFICTYLQEAISSEESCHKHLSQLIKNQTDIDMEVIIMDEKSVMHCESGVTFQKEFLRLNGLLGAFLCDGHKKANCLNNILSNKRFNEKTDLPFGKILMGT